MFYGATQGGDRCASSPLRGCNAEWTDRGVRYTVIEVKRGAHGPGYAVVSAPERPNRRVRLTRLAGPVETTYRRGEAR